MVTTPIEPVNGFKVSKESPPRLSNSRLSSQRQHWSGGRHRGEHSPIINEVGKIGMRICGRSFSRLVPGWDCPSKIGVIL